MALAAQTDLDRVMGYATPVLAERAHIAGRAQAASVRRKAGEGPARLLGEAVDQHLRERSVEPGSVDWDAWRREDGRWTVVADFEAGDSSRRAEFVFDAPGRYVVAENDEARRLVGEPVAPKSSRSRAGEGTGRRLAAVAPDEELPLGEDAIELVSDEPAGSLETAQQIHPVADGAEAGAAEASGRTSGADDEPTTDLSPAARAVRSLGRERRPSADRPDRAEGSDRGDPGSGATGDADWIATQASDRPAGRPAADPAAAPAAGQQPDQQDEADQQDATESSGQPESPDAGARRAKKNRRASVPSWDEIMFGGGKRE
ncbi:DUF3071 domain-containing protein [Nocardioides mesophilus]|uniref:DUF3071 domain-containing protein n=1 Tax=Nocardioides mesophilus TaxID=433659 RepID=A0A7G9RBL7_9ACTN|nr:DUF3071 domain-containing protein [Nocardioides mesophilus]